MMQHHNYSLTELDNMMPWEREIYSGMLMEYIKEENRNETTGELNNGPKKLEQGVQHEHFDVDGDIVVTDEELSNEREMIRIDNETKKKIKSDVDHGSIMGMLLYPVGILIRYDWL